jgi:hypothetical protein
MRKQILEAVFSLNGASFAIGATGFLSGLVTMFVNVSEQISVKWLLLAILLSLCWTLALLKIIYDQAAESKPSPPFENPIKYVTDEQVFVIRRNDNFINNILVGCYSQRDGIDRLAYLAVVHVYQEKLIQIKLLEDFQVLPSVPTTADELKMIEIRPVVPFTALQQYTRQEKPNE